MTQRTSLADRRGSVELHLDIDLPDHSTDTLNPKSSEPLLGNKTNVFFMGLDENHSTTQHCDVVHHNTSAMESSPSPDPEEKSSNGVPLRGSIEKGKNSIETEAPTTNEQPL